jgi:phosphoglucomutase
MTFVDQHVQIWLKANQVTEQEKQIIQKLAPLEKEDAFFKNLEFGTAGLRGILGLGPNRMNRFTVQKATIAFGLYIQKQFIDIQAGIVIAHDNRHQSKEFTLQCSTILNQMGIKVFVFDDLRPTPELSFAIRQKKALGGIMVTASHNPKEYNGYKVYDENGCQLTPDRIQILIDTLNNLPSIFDISIPQAKRAQTIVIEKEMDDAYLNKIATIQLHPELDKSNFKIVYSPQHGCGYALVPKLFSQLGYNLVSVPSQAFPHPDFPGTLSPNPEDEKAYIEPFKLARTLQADIVLISDPDADRVGFAYRDDHGEYITLSGNVSAALLADYLFSQRKALGLLSSNGVMFDTIVCSPLAAQIAKKHGLKVETFLTGFKFIGDRIDFYEKIAGPHFEFGYEESYGCLIAPFVRDKDALQALLMYAEMALFYQSHRLNLTQVLDRLYQEFGYRIDHQISQIFKGPQGQENMQRLLNHIREKPFQPIQSFKVKRVDDFLKQSIRTVEETNSLNHPKSDVIKLYLEDGSTIMVRPSGTEPKCKFYFSVVGNSHHEARKKNDEIVRSFFDLYNIKA